MNSNAGWFAQNFAKRFHRAGARRPNTTADCNTAARLELELDAKTSFDSK